MSIFDFLTTERWFICYALYFLAVFYLFVSNLHTHIAPGETYIDLDCSWGGVEIYVPSDWKVVFKCNAFFGGCDDKRWQNGNINKESVLVIRGTLSFGGLEVKG